MINRVIWVGMCLGLLAVRPLAGESRSNGQQGNRAVVPAFGPAEIEKPEGALIPLRPVWKLAPTVTNDGRRLIAEIGPDAKHRWSIAQTSLDLTPYADRGLRLVVRASGSGIGKPDQPWDGIKFQVHYKEADGTDRFCDAAFPQGDFSEREFVLRVDLRGQNPKRASMSVGIQGAVGKVVFDLDSLKIGVSDGLFRKINEDYRVSYPERVKAAPQLCGVMLPFRTPTEDDFRTLHDWGATLARYQMAREGNADPSPAAYDAWLSDRLDCLERVVLPLARKYGLRICVDLHSVPGGHNAARRETALLSDVTSKDRFVGWWKKIAARFRGHPEIYGYDLINEPVQFDRSPAGLDYWNVQREAAEAVRAIDPETPIIIESNLWDCPATFAYLSPLKMDNVIYQVHMYQPGEYTHQGVGGRETSGIPYPNLAKGVDKDYLRRQLEPVRAFERQHGAKIFVGEFSAVAWAPGADAYLRDLIDLFREYRWDWTYHSFREYEGWSVEHEGEDARHIRLATADTPRKRVLLEGFRRVSGTSVRVALPSDEATPAANAKAIQKALDGVSAAGGGVVRIPSGEWLCGTIRLRSRVELRLEDGAVLKASPNLADYNPEDEYPENWGCPPECWSGRHFLIGHRVAGAALTGKGVIDGNADAFFTDKVRFSDFTKIVWANGIRDQRDTRPGHLRPGQLIVFVKSNDLLVEGVTVRNATCWSLFFHGCDNVTVRDFTVRNRSTDLNTDGIDIDCSSNVLVERADIETGDDAITVRASQRHLGIEKTCEHVRVRDCTLSAFAMPIRIGVGDGHIRDIDISNVRVRHGAWGVSFDCWYGKPETAGVDIEDVRIRDSRFDGCYENWRFRLGGEKQAFGVRNVRFENCVFTSPRPGAVGYCGTKPLAEIRFDNCVWTPAADNPFCGLVQDKDLEVQ